MMWMIGWAYLDILLHTLEIKSDGLFVKVPANLRQLSFITLTVDD